MKLLIDNALSPRLAQELVAGGIDAVHVRDLGLGTAADAVIQATAAGHGLVVVSRDGDFAALLAHSGDAQPSFVHLRVPRVNRISEQVALLRQVLALAGSELEQGAIVTVRAGRIRVRALPLRRSRETPP